jgi:hypothetical protein
MSAPQPDTLSTTATVTASTSTVTRTSAGKKSTGSAARKTSPNNSVRPADSARSDSILGRDSVIRLPIRRLPPVKR